MKFLISKNRCKKNNYESKVNKNQFSVIQDQFADIPGEEGVLERQRQYKDFFLRFGKDVRIEAGCHFTHPQGIVLDDDVRINRGALIYGSGGVWIGRHTRIGPRCFIHSSNHDVSDFNIAYHDRGYIDAAVHIGDLCLISSNVSILPGAEIGAGSFVACGAVVTKGIYVEGSRLQGVPAVSKNKEISPSITKAPDIVIVTPTDLQWKALAEHILTSLGLPQVLVIIETVKVPKSAHSILLFGPPGWSPSITGKQKVWRLARGDTHISAPDLPQKRMLQLLKIPRHENTSADILYNWTAFWVLNRLAKRSGPLNNRELQEWFTTLIILRKIAGVKTPIEEAASERLSSSKPTFRGNIRYHVKRSLIRFLPSILSYRRVMNDPELLVWAALEGHAKRPLVEDFAKRMLPNGANGARLTAFAISALIVGADECASELVSICVSDEWLLPGTLFLRTTRERDTPLMSPLTLALWAMAGEEGLTKKVSVMSAGLIHKEQALSWIGFDNKSFVNTENNQVSDSLIENWKLLHGTPMPDGFQFFLDNQTYEVTTLGIEMRWFDVFRAIQGPKPLIKLHPWPAGYKSAMSLRYDVDRAISSERLKELVNIQGVMANAPCAAWYYFPKDSNLDKQKDQLNRHFQEVGCHLLTADDGVRGVGATHHSSINSEYWAGEKTNYNLELRGVTFGEFLATRLPSLRLMLPNSESQKESKFWLMPLHFPLEGNTQEIDLSYFNERRDFFRENQKAGGFVIVSSHPDIKISLIKELLQEKWARQNIWFVVPAKAIERFEKVMSPGAVTAIKDKNGWSLLSKTYIADLGVEIWDSGQNMCRNFKVQLIKDRPRHFLDSNGNDLA